jgi:hypothetical protein
MEYGDPKRRSSTLHKVMSVSSLGKSVTGGVMEDVMELERSGCTYLDRPRRWKEEE